MTEAQVAHQNSSWLDDDTPPPKAGFVVRKATPGEVLAVYGAGMTNIVGAFDGQPMAMVSMYRMEGRLWAMMSMMAPPPAKARISIVRELRKGLRDLGEPVWIVAQNSQAGRLLELIGLIPTAETMGMRADGTARGVWQWTSA